MIELRNVTKIYALPKGELKALDDISLKIEDNDYIGIVGHSGSGKSTLLNVLARYENVDKGSYYYNDINVFEFNSQQRDNFNKKIGFIFQDYQLLDYMPIKDNILLGSIYLHDKIDIRRIISITDKLKISDLLEKYPHQLSGGEKQRVAIARILLGKRKIILADEPTGALDKENGEMIMNIFDDLYKIGLTIIIVTHDDKVAFHCHKIIRMENGHVLT